MAITYIRATKVSKKLKHQIVKAVPKKCKKISISDKYFKKDETFVRAHMALALEPGGRPIEKIIYPDQLKNVAERARAALGDKPYISVKKFTLTEFGQYMNILFRRWIQIMLKNKRKNVLTFYLFQNIPSCLIIINKLTSSL